MNLSLIAQGFIGNMQRLSQGPNVKGGSILKCGTCVIDLSGRGLFLSVALFVKYLAVIKASK